MVCLVPRGESGVLAGRFTGSPEHFVFDDERHLPDDGLVEASQTVDLLLMGSRGLQGVAALGSTSERVAHRAASSVLIVR